MEQTVWFPSLREMLGLVTSNDPPRMCSEIKILKLEYMVQMNPVSWLYLLNNEEK